MVLNGFFLACRLLAWEAGDFALFRKFMFLDKRVCDATILRNPKYGERRRDIPVNKGGADSGMGDFFTTGDFTTGEGDRCDRENSRSC
jgi:hypothetical protein